MNNLTYRLPGVKIEWKKSENYPVTGVTSGRMLDFPLRREGEYIAFVVPCSFIFMSGDCIMLDVHIFLVVAGQKFSYC